ncbi:MAG: hypothetical protein HY401_05185 [Elusimicrobia bacterium]|nr:hypothetical protein [Elusimicrobiota bacterium]
MNRDKKKAALLLLLLLLIGGSVAGGIFFLVFSPRQPGWGKDGNRMSKFGTFLEAVHMKDLFDSSDVPDELKRAQLARGAGQFSDANYGKGSLGFIKGGIPGKKDGTEDEEGSDEEEDTLAGADAVAAGSGAGGDPMSQIQGQLKGLSQLGQQGSGSGAPGGAGGQYGYGAGGAAGGRGTGVYGNTYGPAGASGDSLGSAGGLKGRRGRMAYSRSRARAGNSLRRSGADSRRGVIYDLKNRAQTGYEGLAEGTAQLAAGGLDIAMVGRGNQPELLLNDPSAARASANNNSGVAVPGLGPTSVPNPNKTHDDSKDTADRVPDCQKNPSDPKCDSPNKDKECKANFCLKVNVVKSNFSWSTFLTIATLGINQLFR